MERGRGWRRAGKQILGKGGRWKEMEKNEEGKTDAKGKGTGVPPRFTCTRSAN